MFFYALCLRISRFFQVIRSQNRNNRTPWSNWKDSKQNMAPFPPHADDNSDGSESSLSIQEVVIDDSNPVIFHAGPSNATSSLPQPATPSHSFLIPKTDYAPAYSSPFLINLYENYRLKEGVTLEQLFEHLNCFQLTPSYNNEGPTLNSLKQHAAAICCLIYYLHRTENGIALYSPHPPWPSDAPKFSGAFDFLNDVDREPFPEEGLSMDPQHSKPLAHLLNSLTSHHPGLGVLSHNQAQLLREAEEILAHLDKIYSDTGGLRSIPLPPPHSSMRESLLARWIEYVQRLKRRLISLQSESIALRQALSHEVVVPRVRAKWSRTTANEKVIPQDCYIFTGLSGELHTALRQQLDMTKDEAENRENRAHIPLKEGSRGIFHRGWDEFNLDGNASGTYNQDRQRNVKAWIETSSRLYKIRGHDTIFVIPGFGVHPDAQTIDQHDLRILEQLSPDPKKKEKMEARKEAENKVQALEATVEKLRRNLRNAKEITIKNEKIAVLAKVERAKAKG